jgi:hypothetical protein
METQHTAILKRAGIVLVVVGLIDIAVMIYCIVKQISYSSSFNIFAVIAGIFLMRGSLQAASIVRWFAVFMLSAFVALLFAFPFLQPVSLTLMQLRLDPVASVATVAFMAFVLGLLAWLIRELGSEPIQAARASAGRKQRDMRIPAAAGVGLVVVIGTFLALLLGGESANRAKSLAEQQAGPGYRYHVSSLNIVTNREGTIVSGEVTAWNDKEIRNIPVRWEENSASRP